MKTIHRRMPGARAACGFLLLGVVLHGGPVRAQDPTTADPLAAVKDKYGSAAYEEALKLLDDMKPAESDAALRAEIEKHRALCYLALRNNADADKAIERFVTIDPEFVVDKLDASTWVRDRFRTVRRKVLPGVVTAKYDEATKNARAKAYDKAVPQLKLVLKLLDDPDITGMAESSRADLRTIAQGFLDLAVAATTPPPPPAPEPKPAEPKPAPPPQAMLPAVKISGSPPAWPSNIRLAAGQRPQEGMLELTIDEKGNVTAVKVLVSVHPFYDPLLRDAALTWKYKPATKGGVPVPTTVQVTIKPAPGGTGPVEFR